MAKEYGGFEQFGVDPGSVTMMRLPIEAQHIATRYGERLARALHYMHTGKIFLNTGEVWARVYSNAEKPDIDIPPELFLPLSAGSTPRMVRSGQELHDQFSYKYLIIEEGAASCFLVRFGESMTILATAITKDDAGIDEASRAKLERELE